MGLCWHGIPERRPNFSTMIEKLQACLQVGTTELGFPGDLREQIMYILQFSSKGHSPVMYIDMVSALIYLFRLANLLDVKEIFMQTSFST